MLRFLGFRILIIVIDPTAPIFPGYSNKFIPEGSPFDVRFSFCAFANILRFKWMRSKCYLSIENKDIKSRIILILVRMLCPVNSG